MAGSAAVMKAYEAWEHELMIGGEGTTTTPETNPSLVPKNVQRSFDLARRAYELREPFEDALIQTAAAGPGSSDHLAAYLAYIKVEESGKDADRVKLIYERAIAAFPVTHFLWLQYGWSLESLQLSVQAEYAERYWAGLEIYDRACRNCPWVGEIWARRIRLQERSGATQDVLDLTYSEAMKAGLQGAEDIIMVALSRVDSLRRSLQREMQKLNDSEVPHDVPTTPNSLKKRLRTVFMATTDLLSSQYPYYFDPEMRLTKYWACCEINFSGLQNGLDSCQAAREIWEDALKRGVGGRYADTWLHFVHFERRYGESPERVRALFQRCYTLNLENEGQRSVCQAWLRFEGEEGSEEDYFNAWVKVEPFLSATTVAPSTDFSYRTPAPGPSSISAPWAPYCSGCSVSSPACGLTSLITPPR